MPERDLALKLGVNETRVHVIPNGVDPAEYEGVRAERQPDTLVFTGPFAYEPNYRAMVWFQQHVYPTLAAKRPDLRVIVTGDHQDRPVAELRLPDDDRLCR